MAHTLSSKGDESQSNRYSFVYDRTPNPLLVNTNVQLSDISSMSRFLGSQGLDFPEKHVEGLSGRYSGCSTSYPREASPSRWQLSNQNSNTDYVSSNRTSENFLSATQLHMQHEPSNIQCSSSGFTCKNFENGGWKQFPDAATSYIAQVSPIISTSNHLSLPNEATGAPVMIEGEMFRELLGRLGSNHHNMSSLETIVPVTGGAHHQESPMATGCSWNEVDDASRSMDLSVNLSNEGLSHRGTDLAASLAHFPSHIPEFACMSPFSNVSSSGGAVNVTLSHEAASRFVGQSNNQSSGGATPQSSPSAILYKNPSHKFSTCENTGKIGNSIHDVVPTGENAVEGAGDLKRYKSGACHLGVSLEEARSCQNGAVSANSSDSGQYAAMHGLMLCKGLVVDTFGNGQQNCISGSKAKEMSCLSEASKQKLCETKSKRQRTFEASKAKEEPKVKLDRSSSENSGNSSPSSAKENLKPPEPPKQDYIHVRARRGQATDSHSLAERVRREKISERMKFLQDLVPGCSKVTGKALMLDEIINYVQSLQHQVEFLSMKLAAVNPRLDFNFDNLLSKEALSSFCPLPTLLLGADNATNLLQFNSTQQSTLQLGLSCGLDLRPSEIPTENNFPILRRLPVPVNMNANSGSQASGVWDGELQSVVQMGFGSGHFPLGQAKADL